MRCYYIRAVGATFFQRRIHIVPMRLLRCPGVEVTDKTVKLSRYARLCYISAKFSLHPIVFPLRSLRGRCRLRQMRCNYIRAVGATLLTYVSVWSITTGRDTAKNVFVECKIASKKTINDRPILIMFLPDGK